MENKVLDNVFPDKVFESIRDLCFGDDLLWNFSNVVAMSDVTRAKRHPDAPLPDDLEYYHVAKLYDKHHPLSKHIKYVEPVLDFLKIKALIRVRFIMYPNHGHIIKHTPHRDYTYEHKAALLYLNTCNGSTEFENGDVVESKENRICLHDGSQLHNSTTCTDAKVRALLTVNYF